METFQAKLTVSAKIIYLLVVFFCLILALFTLMHSLGLHTQLEKTLGWSLQTKGAKIRAQSRQVLTPLEYMVWPAQRREVVKQAEQYLKQQLNLRPHDAELWRAMIYISAESEIPIEERYWLLKNAHQYTQWKSSSSNWLAPPCVEFYQALARIDATLCELIIQRLPNKFSLSELARIIQVDPVKLEMVLKAESVFDKLPGTHP